MIVGIDATRALRAQRTGTERYSLEIIQHLLGLTAVEEHEWRLYVDDTPNDGTLDSLVGGAAARVTLRRLASRRVWTHRALAGEVLAHRPDVLFVPAHVIPLRQPSRLPPCVVTIHDLGYHYWAGMHTRTQRAYLGLSTRWSASAARRVICVSQATADDLCALYGTDRDKVHVVHEGVNRLVAGNTVERCSRQYGVERPFALYVGTIQPRKNLARLLHAYARLVEEQRIGWDLVLAGKQGWHSDSLYALAKELKLEDRVHFLGYVPDSEIGSLLAEALFFCFPSLYEGFGLPVLEAQAAGVSVMTANNSSLPEIAGDAALLVDPNDVDAIADAMLQLSKDDALRERLIAAGYENVKRFSWEKAAAETLAILEAAAADGKSDG